MQANVSLENFSKPDSRPSAEPREAQFVCGDFFNDNWERQSLEDESLRFDLIHDYTVSSSSSFPPTTSFPKPLILFLITRVKVPLRPAPTHAPSLAPTHGAIAFPIQDPRLPRISIVQRRTGRGTAVGS